MLQKSSTGRLDLFWLASQAKKQLKEQLTDQSQEQITDVAIKNPQDGILGDVLGAGALGTSLILMAFYKYGGGLLGDADGEGLPGEEGWERQDPSRRWWHWSNEMGKISRKLQKKFKNSFIHLKTDENS